jgi:hypothetical protein
MSDPDAPIVVEIADVLARDTLNRQLTFKQARDNFVKSVTQLVRAYAVIDKTLPFAVAKELLRPQPQKGE